MRTKLTRSIQSMLFGCLFATTPALSQLNPAGHQQPQLVCDSTLTGTKSFEDLQNLIDSGADLNGDGTGVICIAGSVVNDETVGDARQVITAHNYDTLVLRGVRSDGSQAIIRKTTYQNHSLDQMVFFMNSDIRIENIRFIYNAQRQVGLLNPISLGGSLASLKNVSVFATTTGADLIGMEIALSPDAEFSDITINVSNVMGESVALDTWGHATSIDGLVVRGNPEHTSLFALDESEIDVLNNLDAGGLKKGITLGYGSQIGSLTNTRIFADDKALEIQDGASINVLQSVEIRSCSGIEVAEEATLGVTSSFSIRTLPSC